MGVYTPLKTRTWLNTLVGAIPGALPVLIGWTGVGAAVNTRCVCLFLLVFLWQFPHFMAIAWLYRHQYQAAGMQMLTVVDATGMAQADDIALIGVGRDAADIAFMTVYGMAEFCEQTVEVNAL